MNKEQFKELIHLIKNIQMKLDVLVKILRASIPKPKITPEESKILKFCNKKHTIDDIMKKTGKTRNSVKVILTRLRNKGYIQSTKIEDKLVYHKI